MKQINFILFAFIATMLLSACKTKTQKEVERISVISELISDSLYTRMPGKLFKVGKYAIWEDPFGTDGFMHIIDTETKEEIATMGKKGQGPNEFNTPLIGKGGDNTMYVFDLNSKKQALFSLHNLMSKKDYYIPLPDATDERVTYKMQLDDKSIVSVNPTKSFLFKIEKNASVIEFGEPFTNKDIDNPYDIYQGAIDFNKNKNRFVYTSYAFPYIEIYDMKESKPSLVFASEIPSDAYSIEGKKLRPNAQKNGALGLALLKDYIITIQRDYEVDKTDESTVDMDFEKLPTTLFLYNYKGELKKIVDIGVPIFRIAGDIESNELYAIGVDPEFVLMRCEL